MKKLLWVTPLVLGLVILAFVLYIKLALPDVGPAPDIQVEITPERLERGEYLATVLMSCVDCHSQRDFTKYAGPITGVPFAGGGAEFTEETGAPGDFYAPNLTPFHLGEWTDGEIYRAITTGVSKNGRALFPSMPYHLYGQASDEDIYAIIAYLRTLSPYESTVPESNPKFPFGLILNFMPKKQEAKPIPDKNNIVAYGEYVIKLAACYDCHTPMKKGKYIQEKAYSGNMEFILPNGIVRSSNITPDKETGIGNWTEEMFINRFRVYSAPDYAHQDVGDGFNTTMPWHVLSKIDEYDLKAIYAYLTSLEPVKNQIIKYQPRE
ncbi:MAG: cytochrome c [Prolixibacteraceae bacterium]|nr:cytochrome c [Prolixibacteraceae bacterium]